MKKTSVALFLALICMFSLSACTNGITPPNNGDQQHITDRNSNTDDSTNSAHSTSSDIPVVCEHDFTDWNIIKEASCKEEGVRIRTCNLCSLTEESTVEISSIHTEVMDAAVQATCQTTGLTEGSHCSVCNMVLVEQTVVPVADHTPVTDAAVPASCKTEGLTEGSHCAVCNTVLVKQTTVPMKDHTVVIDAAVPATCHSKGLTEGSHCSVCKAVIVKQKDTALAKHNYKSEKISATQTTQGYTLHICTVCGDSYKDGYYDFSFTESLTYKRNRDGTCLVTGITDKNVTTIIIPEKSPAGDTVVGIKAHAFTKKKITSVTAPETLKYIEERAFSDCYSLSTVYIPGVETIGDHAFSGCQSLRSVIYSDSMTTIGQKAFGYCYVLTECRAVSSTKNLDTIINFGSEAFIYSGITNPTFSANLTNMSLANSPFEYCTSLGKVDLSAASIDSLFGFSHTTFTEFVFPKNVTRISRSCFAGCSFKGLTIPDTVTIIDDSAFTGSYYTKITLGSNVETIGIGAFANSFGRIDLSPATHLTSIGRLAFSQCSESTIILPASVTSIGDSAFAECEELKVLGIPFISTSPISDNTSTNCFGRIFSNRASMENQDEFVPKSLRTIIITAPSVEIERTDFARLNISVLVLPKDFTCDADLSYRVSSIYYHGTQDTFPGVTVSHLGPKIYYYSEKRPEVEGNYWRYVQGIPTAW